MTRVVLASASPRRRELLAALVPEFAVRPADIDERTDLPPAQAAVVLAVVKALAVAADIPDAVVIGSDTVVFDDADTFGKPSDAADAARILRALRGRAHTATTGVAVVCDGRVAAASSSATVTMAALPDAALEAYIASGRPLDKAGAYAIQDDDVPTVTSLNGCYCAVMGLPLWRLRTLLEEAGITCADPSLTVERCADCPERPNITGAAPLA